MKFRHVSACLLVALLVPAALGAQPADADSLFERGRLAEAERGYAERLEIDPTDATARARLGLLALWSNDLVRADSLLPPDEDEARGELRYRQGRFAEAAAHFRRRGREAMAAKLEALVDPYATTIDAPIDLPFAPGALLPVVRVRVNGRESDFLVDTGAGETIVDPEFAGGIGARTFGADSGTYAGGQRTTFEHAAVDSIALGDAVVRNVPIHIQPTGAYAPAAGGRSVSGILGTGILSRFRSTIDFGRGALRLEPPGPSGPEGGARVPFRLLGDHFITVEATAVDSVPTLLVFDTGLAMPGGALVPSAGLLAATGVRPEGAAFTGVGGGGSVQVIPFRFPRLRVGGVERADVLAVAGTFPPVLETRFGPRIGGLLSHGFYTDRAVTLDFRAMELVVGDPLR